MPARVHPLSSVAAFRLAYREGRRLTGDVAVLYARPNGLPVTRIGISVRRSAGSAVRRNRIRRRVREAIRLERDRVAGGFDVVLVPRIPAADAPFTALREAVRGLLRQAGVVRGAGEGF
ncbi:MAG: ribonuclease P protein component [Armatimonadetes bacterium 13_1_40CM_3_65_7]|uniref:Ribonuclease P protein component n=1 Tax=Candidatus Segetimicrobium genomatis TaxID=2569760 RepID=A0A537L1E1_9BACT|nr:MAG: ribonuclease P protein component [Armatimonadetes bacterium 13_1_40CM_3_65_7]TMJ01815.1 MAG: ribonuclease P protein component [Terrabacteria group bacterium ANGP1]